jgi:hypothetical protein
MSAVETQSDVGFHSAVLEDMTGEPHDRRRVVDAQPVAVTTKSHFSGWLRRRPDGRAAIDTALKNQRFTANAALSSKALNRDDGAAAVVDYLEARQ